MNLNALLTKFASRKLVAAVGTIVPLLCERQWVPAAAIAVTYLGAQGVVDARTVARIARDVEVAARVVETAAGAQVTVG